MSESSALKLWNDALTGSFEFGRWETPFENAHVDLVEVRYLKDVSPELLIRLFDSDAKVFYQVHFEWVGAYRVLDEHGLTEFWEKTSQLGGRPGEATFKVRHHLWSKESVLSFFHSTTEGWSFVIATDDMCVEVVASVEPKVNLEG